MYLIEEFLEFLIEAKKSTYASQGDEASVPPQFNGSKQLEYKSGDYFYRDVYFGMSFFVGQEIVEYKNKPIWSMVYSGGMTGLDYTKDEISNTYRMLRKALKLVDKQSLYRGPSAWKEEEFTYLNEFKEKSKNFYGYESISKNGRKLYELRYNGGILE